MSNFSIHGYIREKRYTRENNNRNHENKMRENRDATRPGFLPQGRWYRSMKKLILNAIAKKMKKNEKTVFVRGK